MLDIDALGSTSCLPLPWQMSAPDLTMRVEKAVKTRGRDVHTSLVDELADSVSLPSVYRRELKRAEDVNDYRKRHAYGSC